MVLDPRISRPARIFVDNEGVTFDEANARFNELTLEIVVGPDAVSPAAQAAILTAVAVGRRTFCGGVRVTGSLDLPFNSALPLRARTLGKAALWLGVKTFESPPSRRIIVGTAQAPSGVWAVSPWWDGWRVGTFEPGETISGEGNNPLAGIAAGALAVGAAFDAERGKNADPWRKADLWPTVPGREVPAFAKVYLPSALRVVGLGNLGQAYLWALSALPYSDPADLKLVLQDIDRVSEENWGTSVLVRGKNYGELKTLVGERWALAKGFKVRRLDRRLVANEPLDNEDPRVVLSGVDRIEARRLMAKVDFNCIVDAGLGPTSSDFDKYRVTVFDKKNRIDRHFAEVADIAPGEAPAAGPAYRLLEEEIGSCGAAEIAGASVAAPYVSSFAATVAISRLIAVASRLECPRNEVRRISEAEPPDPTPLVLIDVRGVGHAGRPDPGKG